MFWIKAGPNQEKEEYTQRNIMLAYQNQKLQQLIDIADLAINLVNRGASATEAIKEAKAFHDGILALKDDMTKKEEK